MEYPFKDLLPLDEVLEREGYYKDWTHLDPNTFYSIAQISKMIKTKGYGADVRLLIAQLAEHFGLSVVEVTDIANNLIKRQSTVENRQDSVENFNNQVIQEMTDKDVISAPEIIAMRLDKFGNEFDLAGDRLDKSIKYLNYEMFGLDGSKKYYNPIDGKYYTDSGYTNEYTPDDGIKIRHIHELANLNNVPVINTGGDFVIRQTRHIPVRTNTDLGNTNFLIDEAGNGGSPYVFRIESDNPETQLTLDLGQLHKGQVEIPHLAEYEGYIGIIEDELSHVGLRSGNAQNYRTKRDLFYIGQGGAIDGEISWDYDQVTKVIVKKIDDTYLTFKGGNFIYSGDLDGDGGTGYVHQGILVTRSKTRLETQRVNFEKVDGSGVGQYGFYEISKCYDVTLDGIDLKSRLGSAGSTYGLTAELVTKLKFKNIDNSATDDYWGVMGSNDVKDMSFENCVIGRIDTHFHAWNLSIEKTRTNGIHVTGVGFLKIDDTVVTNNSSGDGTFVTFRSDYGSIWDGPIEIDDSKLVISKPTNTKHFIAYFGAEALDFGQDIYFGHSVKIHNFTFEYLVGNDNDANIIYTTNARDFGGRKPYFPDNIDIRNVKVTGRDKGVKVWATIDLNRTKARRLAEFTRSGNQITIKPNASYVFEDIQTTHIMGNSHQLDGHIGFNNTDPTIVLDSIIPKITIKNGSDLKLATRNIPCQLDLHDSTVSTLYSEINAKISLVNSDIVPNFISVSAGVNAFEFNASELKLLGCKIYPLKHNGVVNLGWSIGRIGFFDLGSTPKKLNKASHFGTTLSKELYDHINSQTSDWTQTVRDKFYADLGSSPIHSQFAEITY